MSEPRYRIPAIVMHWLMALVVLFMFGLGWWMVDLPQGAQRSYYFALHKSLGISLFLLLGARLAWRFKHRPPALPVHVAVWQQRLAGAVHAGLYVLLFLQPLSGYLSSSFSGYKTRLFTVPLPHWGWRDAPLNELFTEIHVVSAVLLAILVLSHLAGALSHVAAGQANLLKRMWPW